MLMDSPWTIIKVIWDVIEQQTLPQTGWDGGIGDGTEMHNKSQPAIMTTSTSAYTLNHQQLGSLTGRLIDHQHAAGTQHHTV
jgi:hypothetical protein